MGNNKTTDELLTELKNLQQKYQQLELDSAKEIAELKKNEESLKLRMMFLEGIANSTFDGFLVVDPNGRKILQTQRTIDLWKIPPEVVEDPSGDKQVAHVMHMTVDPIKFVEEIKYQIMHPDEKRLDEIELTDGTILERYSSPVIDSNGNHYGRIYTFHDITERKNIEKQLVDLNTDKDRFISILAHDLRSPFNSLLGLSQVLNEQYHKMSSEQIESITSSMNSMALKTFQLLEDTLKWASVHNRKLTFKPTKINLNELISEVVDILEPMASNKKISLENKVIENIEVTADLYMIKAILRNLISNAIKFTPEMGTICLKAVLKNNSVTIKVIDNGVGISPEIASKLFSFSTVTTTKGTADETGSGLGLMLCKTFVEKHNGKIWVESEKGQGTTVSFLISMSPELPLV